MITLIDGMPGGGKSYYMVRHIALNHDKYYKVFTNINEFKFDAFSNVYPLSDSKFFDLMERCRLIYDDESKTDQDIIDFLIEEDFLSIDNNGKISPALIVYDEVHNLIGRSNDLWLWVLTYHRHLYIDFLFATQDSSLIHQNYRKLIQKIYRALPNDRNIFALIGKSKSNRYQEHLKIPIIDGKHGTFLRNLYIKKEKKYYDLYKAGDEVRSTSVFRRFIYLFAVLGILAALGFFMFLRYLMGTGEEQQQIRDNNTTTLNYQPVIRHKESYSGMTYLVLFCKIDTCANSLYGVSLNIDDLNTTLSTTDSKVLGITKKTPNLANIRLMVSQDFINLFKGAKNEKDMGFNIFN